jgi:hypothetical protein
MESTNALVVSVAKLKAAIVAKANANQNAYDKALEEFNNNNLDALMDATFGKDAPDSTYNKQGVYTKANAKSALTTLKTCLGLPATKPAAPKLYGRELNLLDMVTTETITIDYGSPFWLVV